MSELKSLAAIGTASVKETLLGPGKAADPKKKRPQVKKLSDTSGRYLKIGLYGDGGTGKALPHSALIKTPGGWKEMGKIVPGDWISDPVTGGQTFVAAIYPHGLSEIYEFTFADGRTARASKDHLWKVWVGNSKDKYGRNHYKIMSTEQLLNTLSLKRKDVYVPLTAAIEETSQSLPVAPYVLGALIANGHLGETISYSHGDPEGQSLMVAAVGTSAVCTRSNDITMALTQAAPLRAALDGLGLRHTLAATKFIPTQYKRGSIAQRWEIIRGLFDNDGTADKNGTIQYTTVSKQLADDIQEVIWSLGGIAMVSTKVPTYSYKGEQLSGQLAYTLNVRHPERIKFFSLPAKLARVSQPYQYEKRLRLRIESITPQPAEEATCIAVASKDHLFLTDNYVVTHNTYGLVDLVEKCNLKVLVISTDVGGDGLLTVTAELKARGRVDLADTNVFHLTLGTYDEFVEFCERPTLYFPEIYDIGLDMLVWDGFSSFQQYQVSEYVEGLDSVLDRDGKVITNKYWGEIRNATIKNLNRFLYMHNKKTGQLWHKYITMLVNDSAAEESLASATSETERQKLKKDVKVPFVQGGASKLIGPAFDFFARTGIRSKRDEAGKRSSEFVYFVEPNEKQKAKVRGVKFDPVIPADMGIVWARLMDASNVTPGQKSVEVVEQEAA